MKKKLWNWRKYLDNFLSWLIIFFVIALIWIGAEYTFEGVVHTSYVDSAVCAILSCIITQSISKK